MSSTALPPLPSIRARELEKKAASLAAVMNNNDSSDSTRNQSPPLQDDGVDASKSEPTKWNKYRKDENPQLTSILQNSFRDTMPDERIQQLDMLHKQEQKVFGHHTPLEPNIICDSVHQYIATTSQFLNSFIADANATLEGTNHKLNVLERQMALLESKLAYIPGLIPGEGEEDDEDEGEEKSDDDDDGGGEDDEDEENSTS